MNVCKVNRPYTEGMDTSTRSSPHPLVPCIEADPEAFLRPLLAQGQFHLIKHWQRPTLTGELLRAYQPAYQARRGVA